MEVVPNCQPMIGVPEHPMVLLQQYMNADLPGFALGIEYLGAKYTYIRKVRGDGNCFYRAFLFAYLDQLLILKNDSSDPTNAARAETERLRFLRCIVDSKIILLDLGYSEIAFETFFDVFMGLIDTLFLKRREDLFSDFQEECNSNFYTWYMRLLTAGMITEKNVHNKIIYQYNAYFSKYEDRSREISPFHRHLGHH